MVRLIGARLLRLIATLLAVSFLTFSLTALLPGDPVNAIVGADNLDNQELVAQIRSDLNLDDPFMVRYGRWLGDALQGDLGESYINRGTSVTETIKSRIPVSAQLALMAVGIALFFAVPIGVIGAYKQGKWQDSVTSAGVQVALAIPNFVAGIFFMWLLTVKFRVFPSSGWNRLGDGLWDNFRTAILPASALALTQLAIFSRLLRSDMMATLQENFILSAKAKGLTNRYVLFRHALRPSSLSLITIVGINIGALLGGTVIIETLFSIPGLGFRLINAITSRDYLVIQGITLFVATVYVVINTLVDLIYLIVDPRIRKG